MWITEVDTTLYQDVHPVYCGALFRAHNSTECTNACMLAKSLSMKSLICEIAMQAAQCKIKKTTIEWTFSDKDICMIDATVQIR